MASLDVEALFNNIPLNEVIDICIDDLFCNTNTIHNLDRRLVFSQFFDNRRNVKEKSARKTCSPAKWSAWLHGSTLQNFAARHFFDVNEVSILIL